MNRENNFAKPNSIKCKHPPGGSNQFNLGWGSDNVPKRNRSRSRSTDSNSDFNIITGQMLPGKAKEQKENSSKFANSNIASINASVGKILPCLERDNKPESIKTSFQAKDQFNIFDNSKINSENGKVSSIKVAHTPGGNSNVNFGNDNTSYNDYRRK